MLAVLAFIKLLVETDLLSSVLSNKHQGSISPTYLCAAFAQAETKGVKKLTTLTVFLMLLGFALATAASKSVDEIDTCIPQLHFLNFRKIVFKRFKKVYFDSFLDA